MVLKNPWLGLNPDFSSSFRNSLKMPRDAGYVQAGAFSKCTRIRFFKSGSVKKGVG